MDVGTRGGRFVLSDRAVGRRRGRQEVASGCGDGIVFCGPYRLVTVAGTPAKQMVYHGMSPLEEGERFVLGCPFHEYRG